MARIRTIKPEFWEDSKLGPLPPIDRLVFLGLISQADDAGRVIDNVRRIDGLLFPYTADTSNKSLDTLARLSRICRYTGKSGEKLIQIVSWTRHQKVDHPSKYCLPGPTTQDLKAEPLTTPSRETSEEVAKPSRESRASTYDQRPTTKEPRPAIDDQGSQTLSRSESTNGDVVKVFAHFRSVHPRARLTKKRKALIGGHLRDGYTVDDLTLALDGLHLDRWHNDTGNLTIEYGLRNADKIEQLQAVASNPSHPKRIASGPALSDASKRSVEAGQSWLRRKEANG